MQFSKQEYWSGYFFTSLGDFSHPEIEVGSLTLQADSLLSELPGTPQSFSHVCLYKKRHGIYRRCNMHGFGHPLGALKHKPLDKGCRLCYLFHWTHPQPYFSMSSLKLWEGRKARGPQAAGGNKVQVADTSLFFLLYTNLKEASFNSVLITPGSALNKPMRFSYANVFLKQC